MVDSRLVSLSAAAFPVCSVVAPRRQCRHVALVGILGGDIRMCRRQIIETGEHSSPRAVGALLPLHPPFDDSRVGVRLFPCASPECDISASCTHCRDVALIIPFGDEIRMSGREVIEASEDFPSRAVGASFPSTSPAVDSRLPRVPESASPETLRVALCRDGERIRALVQHIVPLVEQVRICCPQRASASFWNIPHAVMVAMPAVQTLSAQSASGALSALLAVPASAASPSADHGKSGI